MILLYFYSRKNIFIIQKTKHIFSETLYDINVFFARIVRMKKQLQNPQTTKKTEHEGCLRGKEGRLGSIKELSVLGSHHFSAVPYI